MRNIRLFATLIAFAATFLYSYAAKEDGDKGAETEKIYMFGVGTAFGDTLVHFTSITEMEGIELTKKSKFLPLRSAYSLQLKAYLEGTLGLSQQTCCVIFSKSKKKLSKKYYKLKKAYLEESESTLKIIGEEDFKFKKTDIATTRQ